MRGGPGDSRFELKLSVHSSDTVAPEGVAGFKRSAHSAEPGSVVVVFPFEMISKEVVYKYISWTSNKEDANMEMSIVRMEAMKVWKIDDDYVNK